MARMSKKLEAAFNAKNSSIRENRNNPEKHAEIVAEYERIRAEEYVPPTDEEREAWRKLGEHQAKHHKEIMQSSQTPCGKYGF